MPRYEYKVVPAPAKGRKARGVKTPEGRFALAVEQVLNKMGAEGWEYLRADLLPSEDRSGLAGSTVNWRNLLVFRRAIETGTEAFQPQVVDAPDPTAEPPAVAAIAATGPTPDVPAAPLSVPASDPVMDPPLQASTSEAEDDDDNGVEDVQTTSGLGAALTARARASFSRKPDTEDS